MARPFTRKKHVTLTLFDYNVAYASRNELVVRGYADLPEIPEPIINVAPEPFYCKGNLQSLEEADDTVEFADFSITLDILDEQVSSSKFAFAQWFNEFKNLAGAALTSTNTGEVDVQVMNSKTKTLTTIGLPTAWKTIGMDLEFDNDDKKFGKTWMFCMPVDARFSSSGNAQVTINMRILGASTNLVTSTDWDTYWGHE